MNQIDIESARQWYLDERTSYDRLADSVRVTLDNAIIHAKIPYLSVTCRTKGMESYLKKISHKQYVDPRKQMMDIAGIRVIAYIESDVVRIGNLIKNIFNVHVDHSSDKTKILGDDRFGYRSMHYVCDLGKKRLALFENAPYIDRVFEIQVRTVLQHAWAEIEHDRGYKFAGVMPQEIKRRLHLAAAGLESIDREFERLSSELDHYVKEVEGRTASGDFNEVVTSPSIESYLKNLLPKLKNSSFSMIINSNDEYLISILKDFEIYTLEDLNRIVNAQFLADFDDAKIMTDSGWFIALALLYDDFVKYMECALRRRKDPDGRSIFYLPEDVLHFLERKYSMETIKDIVKRYNVELIFVPVLSQPRNNVVS